MESIILGHQQTLFDIAMQCLGNVERVYEIALLNGFGITDEIDPGTRIFLPEISNEDKAVANVFTKSGLRPTSKDLGALPGGIGYMQIGTSFKVR